MVILPIINWLFTGSQTYLFLILFTIIIFGLFFKLFLRR